MIVCSELKRKYPKLANWIELNLPKVKENKRVWDAFKKYSELPEPTLSWAVTPGKFPEIDCKYMPRSNGRYNGVKMPNRIFISNAICDRFEKIDFDDPKMSVFVESCLLHEMVHWGDFKDGVDQPGEEGTNFEVEAYGKNVFRHW